MSPARRLSRSAHEHLQVILETWGALIEVEDDQSLTEYFAVVSVGLDGLSKLLDAASTSPLAQEAMALALDAKMAESLESSAQATNFSGGAAGSRPS